MAMVMDEHYGWGNALRNYVKKKVNEMEPEGGLTPVLDKEHIELRREQLLQIRTSNEEVIRKFADDNGLRHWHTSNGMVFGELSEGCPLCVGYQVA